MIVESKYIVLEFQLLPAVDVVHTTMILSKDYKKETEKTRVQKILGTTKIPSSYAKRK